MAKLSRDQVDEILDSEGAASADVAESLAMACGLMGDDSAEVESSTATWRVTRDSKGAPSFRLLSECEISVRAAARKDVSDLTGYNDPYGAQRILLTEVAEGCELDRARAIAGKCREACELRAVFERSDNRFNVSGWRKSTCTDTFGAVDADVTWDGVNGEVTLVPDPVTGDVSTWGSAENWCSGVLLESARKSGTLAELAAEVRAAGQDLDIASLDD